MAGQEVSDAQNVTFVSLKKFKDSKILIIKTRTTVSRINIQICILSCKLRRFRKFQIKNDINI